MRGAHADSDGRGNWNFYGLFQKSVLAALYSSEGSVMEVSGRPVQLLFWIPKGQQLAS